MAAGIYRFHIRCTQWLSFNDFPTRSSSSAAACLLCGHCHTVIPITNADLEGAKRTETRSTEYGEHHDEGKKPMGQKIKEMLPGWYNIVLHSYKPLFRDLLSVQQGNVANH